MHFRYPNNNGISLSLSENDRTDLWLEIIYSLEKLVA